MKHPIRFAFILAAPIEAVNYFVFPYPLGIGLPDNASWLQKLMGEQWLLIHWPGLQALNSINQMGYSGLGNFVVVLSGYCDTFLLLVALMVAMESFRRLYP